MVQLNKNTFVITFNDMNVLVENITLSKFESACIFYDVTRKIKDIKYTLNY